MSAAGDVAAQVADLRAEADRLTFHGDVVADRPRARELYLAAQAMEDQETRAACGGGSRREVTPS